MYPESEKLLDKQENFQLLSEFLEWLESRGVELCRAEDGSSIDPGTLVYRFIGVDPEKLKQEKVEMSKKIKEALQ